MAQIKWIACDSNHRIAVSAPRIMTHPFSAMPLDNHSIRLVVQHVWDGSSGRSSYRLIGYSDEHTYRPVDFDSLDYLLKVFKAALPTLDVSGFPRARQPVSSILFADVVELSETQRSTLGLEK